MSKYTGRISVPGVVDRPVDVVIDLDDESVSMTSDGRAVGEWDFEDVEVRGRDVGFDLAINGAWGHLDTNDDGGFAIELGLHSAPPRLRRLMLAKLASHPDGS